MPSRAELLSRSIEQQVVSGQLAPGERLDEVRLARQFGVSRTPVREALRQLASVGLVEIRPRRGAVVANVGLERLLQMFEVMAELEGMCGRLAARRMTAAERRFLVRAHRACEAGLQATDPDLYYRHNVNFHETLYSGSHNEFLAEQTRALRNRLAPYRRQQLRQRDRLAESFAEHAAIVEAVVAGDGECADRLLQDHVTVQGGPFVDFVSSLQRAVDRRE